MYMLGFFDVSRQNVDCIQKECWHSPSTVSSGFLYYLNINFCSGLGKVACIWLRPVAHLQPVGQILVEIFYTKNNTVVFFVATI